MRLLPPAALLFALIVVAGPDTGYAAGRDHVRFAGPGLTMELAGAIATRAGAAVPELENMGAADAIAAFCKGPGPEHPDAAGSIRPMTTAEVEGCRANGVAAVRVVVPAVDAVVLAHAGTRPLSLTGLQLWRALARDVVIGGQVVANPYRTWKDVDPGLPDQPIGLIAPPAQSPNRALLADRVLLPACAAVPAVAALDEARRREVCTTLRTDALTPFPQAADTLLRRLADRPGTLVLTQYSVTRLGGLPVSLATIDGVEATPAMIGAGRYPMSRPLHLFVKTAGAATNPGLKAFLAELENGRALGPAGYLAQLGAIQPVAP